MQLKKILSYNVYGDNTDDSYRYVCNLLAQTTDPESAEPGMLDCGGMHTYTSPLRRATSCIDSKTAASFTLLPELWEIPFDLTHYCSESAFTLFKGTAVRQAFIRAFVVDDLLIPHSVLEEEFKTIIELQNKPEDTLIISHTFRLAGLLAYIQIGHDLFTHPESITEFIKPDEKILDFGESILLL